MSGDDTELHIDNPDGAPTLILAHGAGAPMDTPFMTTLATGVAERGVRVVRFEFPYMVERRRSGFTTKRPPDRQPKLLDAWREVVDRVTDDPSTLILGGKSMGGRMASLLADALGVAGLVCLGYPFHPPRKPDKLRVDHLRELTTPTLIVQGTRDRFGTPDEVAGYDLSDAIEVTWIEDGDHSLVPRKRSGRTPEQNLACAIDAVAAFCAARGAR